MMPMRRLYVFQFEASFVSKHSHLDVVLIKVENAGRVWGEGAAALMSLDVPQIKKK